MKKQFNTIAVLCALLVFAAACKKEKQEAQLPDNPITIQEIPVEVKEYFVKMGFDSATATLRNGYYLLEDDVAFSVTQVQEAVKKSQAGAKHSFESTIPSDANANIRVVIGGNLRNDPDWVTAVRLALRKWNVITNCRINFLFDPTMLPGSGWENVVISDANLGYPGLGTFPAGGLAGNLVSIDMAQTATWDLSKRIFLIMHEIGHNIGFRHTDGSYSNNNIPGTPDSGDPYSVMNSGATNLEWDQFSEYDLIAARFLYPVTTNSVLTTAVYGSSILQQGASYYQHASAAGYGCNNISWQLLDANQNLLRNLSSEDEDYDCDEIAWSANNLPVGNYFLKCTVTGGGYTGTPAIYPITVQ